jgi:DNA-binding transcriptional LysR family regulator
VSLQDLDLNLLVVFAAVHRTRSATLAGEELGLSQSAVSNALRRLREHFDDPLFVKTTQGMVPTPLGEALAAPIEEGLARIRGAVEAERRFDAATSTRAFRLYVSDVGQMVFVPRLAAHLREYAPGVSLATVEVSQREAEAQMAAGEIDLAAGFYADFEGRFHRGLLFAERYVVLARVDHPLLAGGLTLEGFLALPHAVYRPSAGSHVAFESRVDRLFAEHGRARRVALRLAHALGIAEVIASSDVIIAVPSRLAARVANDGALRVMPLPFESPAFEISQLWHERSHRDPAHAWLRGVVQTLFADRPRA